jgi:hypothetical protein
MLVHAEPSAGAKPKIQRRLAAKVFKGIDRSPVLEAVFIPKLLAVCPFSLRGLNSRLPESITPIGQLAHRRLWLHVAIMQL